MTSAFEQTVSFNPLQINSCIAWFDGNDKSTMFQDIGKTIPVTQAGQSVVAWVDKSPLGTTSVNLSGTASSYPTLQSNTIRTNKTSLYFDGADYLQFAPVGYPTGATPTTFYCIVNSPNGASSGIWVFFCYGSDKPFGQDTTFGTLAQFRYENGNLAADYYGPNTGTVDTVSVTNVPSMLTTQYSGAAISGWRNGILFSGGSFASPYTYAANVGTNYGYFGVGVAGGAFSQWFTGQIAEIIGYSRALTTQERQQVEGYLAAKWGITQTIASSNPFYYNYKFTQPWKPTSIPGCAVWFDSADSTTLALQSGTSSITNWISKGIYTCSTVNTSNYAVKTLYNGYPTVYFNSTLITTDSVPYASTTGTTWFTCATNLSPITATNPPDASVVIATNGAGPERSIRYNNLQNPPATYSFTMYSINNGVLRGAFNQNANGTRGFIDAPTYFSSFMNGQAVESAAGTTAVSFQFPSQSLKLGQWNQGFLYGYVHEAIIYNSALTIPQYQQVESYLSYKWGFQNTLPDGFPIPSTLGVYSFPPMPNYPTATYPTSVTCVKWYPTQIASLVGWYDAADPTQVVTSPGTTTVTQWKNKSGSGINNTTSANGAPQYTAKLNNKSGITLNGTSSYFVIPKIVDTDWSIFIVLTTTATGGGSASLWWEGQGIFDAEVAGTTTDFGTSLYQSYFAVGTGNPPTGDTTVVSATAINTGAGFICDFQRISSTGYMENFVNGTSQGSTTGGIGPRVAPSRITIGALQTLATFFNGNIYEIIVYSTNLALAPRQQVEGYLAWKWGLVSKLPADHPYKLFPPAP